MPHSTAKQNSLPMPSKSDAAISLRLKKKIIEKIEKEGDISFAKYMEMALYEDGLGYYVSGLRKFGEQGDFVTSPEISPLFGKTLATQIAEIFKASSIDSIFELGAGTGKLAVDILTELKQIDTLPKKYIILDISGEMQQRQKEALTKALPEFINKVEWIHSWPKQVNAVVIANEVLDAMPVERFLMNKNQILQQYVTAQEDELTLIYKPANESFNKMVSNKVPHQTQPYLSEMNTQYSAWFASLFESLNSAVCFFIDYGYPRKEYYMEERNQGTTLCFYRHHAHDDVLLNVGLQDITAFVDFTSVVETATDAGFSFEGFVAQCDFLLSNGITDLLAKVNEGKEEINQYENAKQLKQLTLPGEMGERFKVIGFSKNYQPEITGFAMNDQSHQL